MAKMLILDVTSFKFADNETDLNFRALRNGVIISDSALSATIKIKQVDGGYLKSVSAKWVDKHIVISSGDLSDLPVGSYLLELWLSSSSGYEIYPDSGFVKLCINQNATDISGNLISSITLGEFQQQFSDLAEELIDNLPEGKVGPQGEKGDIGPQGVQGIQGERGEQGIQGVQGVHGDKGEKGDKGDKGDQGIQGVQGIKGADGSQTLYFHSAWAYSADGTDRFTTVYPNLNLLTNSRLQSGNIAPFFATNNSVATINSNVKGLNVKGLNVSYSSGALYSQGGVGQGGIPVSAGNQYTISVKVINTGTVAINRFLLQFGFDSSTGTSLAYPNKTFSLPADGKAYNFSYTYTAPENAIVMRYYCLVVATEANVPYTFTIYDMKDEQDSVATLYMPSASEVKTADYPRYIGQYTDFTQAGSTNPSAYIWSLIRGNDGKDAEQYKVGSVVLNISNSSSGYMTGTWENIGSAVIGSTTIYYWKRTA